MATFDSNQKSSCLPEPCKLRSQPFSLHPHKHSQGQIQRTASGMAHVAKRLSFGDVSVTLAQLAQHDQTSDATIKLSEIARALEELTKLVQARVDGVRDVAMRQLDETGGREALESQQRSLKQSLRDYSQKSTFFDYIRDLSEQHDFGPENQHAEAALKTIKEELSQLQATNGKSERQLVQIIAAINEQYDEIQNTVTRTSQQLVAHASDADDQRISAAAQMPETQRMQQEQVGLLDAALGEASRRAADLEAELAAGSAEATDMEALLQQDEREIAALEAELEALQAEQQQQSNSSDVFHQESIVRLQQLTALISEATGVTLMEVQDNEFALRLTLDIPTAFHAHHTPGSNVLLGGSQSSQGDDESAAAHRHSANAHSSTTGCSSSSSVANTALRPSQGVGHGEVPKSLDERTDLLSASRVFSVVLRMQLHRGSSVLCAAQLEPELFDLSSDVEAACLNEGSSGGGGGSSMRALLASVRVRLVQHWRREMQIEGASIKYPMTPTLPNQPILRAVLPMSVGIPRGHQMEAEVLVPWGWPDNGSSLKLVQVQSSAGSVHTSVMHSLEQQPDLARGSLTAFLDAVHASCITAIASK